MDDKSGKLISAEYDHLTRTGARSVLMFWLFMIVIGSVLGAVLYATAITAEYYKKEWGVEQ